MSLFRTIPTASDFGPLFRLLDDYDVHRSSRGQTSVRSFAPRFDVRESSDAYHLDGELPGIAQKDVDIEFSDPQTLVIKGRSEREYHTPEAGEGDNEPAQGESTEVAQTGQKQVSKSENKPRFWVSERSVGEFHRTFSFPSHVDQERVKASLKNGILSVIVPKAAAPSSKKITVE
ncbi:Hsp20/alpha crystallin family protein [Aspergillus melleus]|uniref:Hsp20/alpha crystallin family protein n=1 Tax=Aspergillus melleus TaxID=138277 RepID=UPI001E8D0C54|nr:heat shock protein [Aspergillus melleus]KAH8424378.1 heat shock protein [Aspergillus melleus]